MYIITFYYIDTFHEELSRPYSFIMPRGTTFETIVKQFPGYTYLQTAQPFYVAWSDMDIYLIYFPSDEYYYFNDYQTPLGISVPINQCGDCFD